MPYQGTASAVPNELAPGLNRQAAGAVCRAGKNAPGGVFGAHEFTRPG